MTDTNTELATVDTAAPNMNPVAVLPPATSAELMAKFGPENQMKLLKIQQGINLSIHLENQKRQTALAVENQRAWNASTLANQEHQNKFTQIRYQADREDQRAAMTAQSAATQAKQTHEHQLERMQVELQNQMALAEFNTQLSIIPKLMEESGKVRSSMLERMKDSDQERNKTHEILVEAVIKEKLAQKQHKRDMEKMQLESSLKRSDQLFQSICLRLSKLLDDSKEEQVKQEIDQLYAKWVNEDKDD